MHVVWEKFCRYFDVEPRIVPLQPDKYTIGPEDVEPHIDENTIGVAAVLGTTFTGHADDIVGINKHLQEIKEAKGIDVPLHVDGGERRLRLALPAPRLRVGLPARAGALDQRLRAQVRDWSIPGIGWLIFREQADLAEDLVFYENYLGKTDATFTLNFSTGSAMVLAQYYALIRFGREGYEFIMRAMQLNSRFLADRISAIGPFKVVGAAEQQLPLVAFQLADDVPYDEFDIAWQVAAERGWMLPAYTMPPNADKVKMLRALVKLNLTRNLVSTLADDIAAACETLQKKGGASEAERKRVKTGVGY